jgi:DNA-binding NtrC family response regulator/CHASE2 domain-containing sensor protein
VVGIAATLAVALVWAVSGPSLTALEWSVYDRGLRARDAPRASSPLVVVVRDPESEARFGTRSWDRAVLARLVAGLSRAGARGIGLDVVLGHPDALSGGGAVSDALLSEATAAAGVVFPIELELGRAGADDAGGPRLAHRSWPPAPLLGPRWPEAAPLAGPLPQLAQHARGVGHVLAPGDADGVVRRVPLFVRLGDRIVPAFGLAMAAAHLGVPTDGIGFDCRAVELRPEAGPPARVAVDGQGRALVPFSGAGLPRGVSVVPFTTVWAAVEQRSNETLEDLVDGRLVLVLAGPRADESATPLGPMPARLVHAHLLDALLAGQAFAEVSPPVALGGTFLGAGLAAWLPLALPWWAGLVGGAAIGLAYAASLPLALTAAGLVLPAWPPLLAVVIASAAALVWNHFASVHRVRQLEGENARVRDALVRHESAVEALEEDLEAARGAVARSTGAERELVRAVDALRAQLAEARAQEGQTRHRLADVERELRGLRPAEARAEATGAEPDELGRTCEDLGIVTRDPALLALFRDLRKAARSTLPILLLGEPGTGKELFARAAHRLSPRADRAFVAVNMAAIPPQLFESELFGHVRGSFTGAVAERKGYLAEADGGTIFLDEIGELPLDHQAKLLRVLQEKTFYRVGASRATGVDVRVVAASNRDLEAGIAEGWFREDLYFRLKGLALRLPPLRERAGDIPRLASRLLADIAAEIGRPRLALSEEAALALAAHDWPGNVRELENVLRQAVALADRSVIRGPDLRLPSPAPRAAPGVAEHGVDAAGDATVLACLREHHFDMQATGRALGWDRGTVTQRLKGLGFQALVESGGDRARAALALAGDAGLARTVALKLREYHEHLLRSVEGFDTPDAAVAACRRRFKNLPERHFRYLESLVREQFAHRG